MVAFSIGSINVYWYWVFYLIWFLIWYFFLKFIGKKKIFSKYKNLQKLLSNDVESLLIYIIIWVFVSLLILKKTKKLSNIEFFLLFDTFLVVVPLAIIFGRFWNYLNQEIYGLVVPANYWWMNDFFVNLLTKLNVFHVYNLVDSNLRLNTNFISIFFEWFVLFLILSITFFRNIKKREIKPWIIVANFLIFYSIFRFFIEYLRVDSQSQYIWLFTKSQRIFLIFIFTGFVFMLNKKIKTIKL